MHSSTDVYLSITDASCGTERSPLGALHDPKQTTQITILFVSVKDSHSLIKKTTKKLFDFLSPHSAQNN